MKKTIIKFVIILINIITVLGWGWCWPCTGKKTSSNLMEKSIFMDKERLLINDYWFVKSVSMVLCKVRAKKAHNLFIVPSFNLIHFYLVQSFLQTVIIQINFSRFILDKIDWWISNELVCNFPKRKLNIQAILNCLKCK